MPRGNLEAVAPRVLVLAEVADRLQVQCYGLTPVTHAHCPAQLDRCLRCSAQQLDRLAGSLLRASTLPARILHSCQAQLGVVLWDALIILTSMLMTPALSYSWYQRVVVVTDNTTNCCTERSAASLCSLATMPRHGRPPSPAEWTLTALWTLLGRPSCQVCIARKRLLLQ